MEGSLLDADYPGSGALVARRSTVASVCPCATNHFRNSSCFIATPDHLPERC
jgi:hypothetical protein